MIKRIWHGWTSVENADAYEQLLKEEIASVITAKQIPGYRGLELLRRSHNEEVEFVTIISFDTLESVKLLVGDDPCVAYIPVKAKEVLSHWNEHAQHYEVRASST